MPSNTAGQGAGRTSSPDCTSPVNSHE